MKNGLIFRNSHDEIIALFSSYWLPFPSFYGAIIGVKYYQGTEQTLLILYTSFYTMLIVADFLRSQNNFIK